VSLEKVFVLDYDLISPLGTGKDPVFSSLENNYLAGSRINRFQTDGMNLNIAAEVNDDLSGFYQSEDSRLKEALFYDRKLELLVSCYHLMKTRFDDLVAWIEPERAGVLLGVSSDVIPFELIDPVLCQFSDNPDLAYGNTIDYLNQNKNRINRVLNPSDFTAIFLANKLNLAAFQKVVLTACAASTQAIALAYDSIRSGEADMVLTGGTDSIIDMISYTAFSKLGVITAGDYPDNQTCRPFDISRNGTLAGESASLIVLASGNLVEKLSLEPKLEIMGYGNTLDGYKITAPDPDAVGMIRALGKALSNSGLTPDQVDYINLHGTGTLANDPLELKAIEEIFGEYAKELPISSTKDRHGHAIAAAGGQEFVITCICMENDFIPCTVNLKNPINETGVRLIKEKNIKGRINIGLTNNFAFGGVNTVVSIKRV
jgi:3-oxoacyl-[acyl-carrier-protein] synthase II